MKSSSPSKSCPTDVDADSDEPAMSSFSRQEWLALTSGFLGGPLLLFVYAQTIAWVYSVDRPTNARYETAVATARDVASAVDRYRRQHHHVPRAAEGLAGLTPDFLPHVPLDPWGNSFVYQSSGADFADVLSYGSDGVPSGEGTASDISARYGRLGSRPPQWLRPAAALLMIGVPLAAFLTGPYWPQARFALAGCATFWASLLLVTVGADFHTAPLPSLAFLTALLCLTGCVGLLQRLPRAQHLTFAALLGAQLLLVQIIVL
jgi:general secretion pathway protein G